MPRAGQCATSIEGELERMLFRHLRDFIAGKSELHPDAEKRLPNLRDQVMSVLDALAAAAELIAAADESRAKRQGTAAQGCTTVQRPD
jgi:predicted component of type VI protein secretion system